MDVAVVCLYGAKHFRRRGQEEQGFTLVMQVADGGNLVPKAHGVQKEGGGIGAARVGEGAVLEEIFKIDAERAGRAHAVCKAKQLFRLIDPLCR